MTKGVSLILTTYHPDRVGRANELIKMLRKDSGIDVQIIVSCDNPETQELYKGADIVVKIPKRVGFNRASNIGEKFAIYENEWWIDDYVTVTPNWGPKALKAFWERFPDGQGIMDISDQRTDCAKSISTRSYVYSLNHFNLLWPEYLHCGDTEMWHRSTATDRFYTYPEVLWTREKIFDECKATTDSIRAFDNMIRGEREAAGWPDTFKPDLEEKLKNFVYGMRESDNPEVKNRADKAIQLYKNLYNKE